MTEQNNKMMCFRLDHFSPTDDLAFDMYLDPEIAEIIRKLERHKRDAVASKFSSSCVLRFTIS